MIFKSHHEINELATKQMGKFSVYVSNRLEMISKEDDVIWEFVYKKFVTMQSNRRSRILQLHGRISK